MNPTRYLRPGAPVESNTQDLSHIKLSRRWACLPQEKRKQYEKFRSKHSRCIRVNIDIYNRLLDIKIQRGVATIGDVLTVLLDCYELSYDFREDIPPTDEHASDAEFDPSTSVLPVSLVSASEIPGTSATNESVLIKQEPPPDDCEVMNDEAVEESVIHPRASVAEQHRSSAATETQSNQEFSTSDVLVKEDCIFQPSHTSDSKQKSSYTTCELHDNQELSMSCDWPITEEIGEECSSQLLSHCTSDSRQKRPRRQTPPQMHSSTDHEDDMTPVLTKKAKKFSAKNDWSIKDPQAELDLIEWYKDNTYLWLITDKEYMNHAKKNNALEDKAKELGITADHINGWWKSNRDTYTKLSRRKSGKELTDLPYKQRWILNNFAFLKQRPTTVKAPVVSIAALVQQHPGDLEAVETEAAEEGHSQITASSSGRKVKSRSEEADFQEALLRSLDEIRGTIAGMMKSASTSEDDYLTLWGRTVVASMRRMSRKRERAFRKDVDDLLHDYSPNTSDDDTFSPPWKTVHT